MHMEKTSINGVEIYPFISEEQLLNYVNTHKSILLIAINAGKIYHATKETKKLINSNIGYIDGGGALKAIHKKGYTDAIKIPGCELWLKLIKNSYKNNVSYYFIGSKQEVIEETIKLLKKQFNGIQIAGYRNGYFTEEEKDNLINDIICKKPNYIFIGMGSPRQELLMQELLSLHPAIYQGLGGSFDLYTGRTKRAPKWFINHNLEGFYRLITNLNIVRLKRYWDDVKFITNVYLKKYE